MRTMSPYTYMPRHHRPENYNIDPWAEQRGRGRTRFSSPEGGTVRAGGALEELTEMEEHSETEELSGTEEPSKKEECSAI